MMLVHDAPIAPSTNSASVTAVAAADSDANAVSDATKHEKISFLQNQISMIEKMLNLCKDEIIREFASRQSNAAGVTASAPLNQT